MPMVIRNKNDAVIGIGASTNLVSAIAAAPSPSVFQFATGVYRFRDFSYSGITPRAGDTFIGVPGTVITGAVVMTGWVQTTNALGPVWYVTGVTDEIDKNGTGHCRVGYPRCDYAEDVYVDDVLQRHVATVDTVTTGTFFYDTTAHRVYVGSDPTGHVVEQARAVRFTDAAATAASVTFRNLTFEKFATPAQTGVILAKNAPNWAIRNNEFRRNHGYGCSIGPGWFLARNYSHHNGQMAMGGGPDATAFLAILVEDNQLAYNNTAGFDPLWEGGGAKFAETDGLVVRGNFSHHNLGPGLWTDESNIRTLYERNLCDDNDGAGILHEISYQALIRWNVARRNGKSYPEWAGGGGIVVSASPNVEVTGNQLENNADGINGQQQSRGSGPYGAHEISNLNVHDNLVMIGTYVDPSDGASYAAGLSEDLGDATYFSGRGNAFTGNHYYVPAASTTGFTWNDLVLTFAQWQAAGQDLAGDVHTGSAPTQTLIDESRWS